MGKVRKTEDYADGPARRSTGNSHMKAGLPCTSPTACRGNEDELQQVTLQLRRVGLPGASDLGAPAVSMGKRTVPLVGTKSCLPLPDAVLLRLLPLPSWKAAISVQKRSHLHPDITLIDARTPANLLKSWCEAPPLRSHFPTYQAGLKGASESQKMAGREKGSL